MLARQFPGDACSKLIRVADYRFPVALRHWRKSHPGIGATNWYTLPKTNSHFAPENRPDFSSEKPSIFRCEHVSFREGKKNYKLPRRSQTLVDTPYSSSRFPVLHHLPHPNTLPSPFRFTQKRGTTLGTCAKKRTFVGSSSCSWQLCHCDSSADPQGIRCTDSSRFKRCHRRVKTVRKTFPTVQLSEKLSQLAEKLSQQSEKQKNIFFLCDRSTTCKPTLPLLESWRRY